MEFINTKLKFSMIDLSCITNVIKNLLIKHPVEK